MSLAHSMAASADTCATTITINVRGLSHSNCCYSHNLWVLSKGINRFGGVQGPAFGSQVIALGQTDMTYIPSR